VFVLIKPAGSSDDLIGAITRALTMDIPWNGQPNFWKAVKRLSGAGDGAVKGDLPRGDWPLMVRFKDINDPNSVEQVDQVAIGVKRVWVETTRDPISTGIEKRLGWLTRINGGYINGGFTSRDAPLGLDGTAFSTEIGK
jgi:hypothetical protein